MLKKENVESGSRQSRPSGITERDECRRIFGDVRLLIGLYYANLAFFHSLLVSFNVNCSVHAWERSDADRRSVSKTEKSASSCPGSHGDGIARRGGNGDFGKEEFCSYNARMILKNVSNQMSY